MIEFFMVWLSLTAVLVVFCILGWIVVLAERLEQRKIRWKQTLVKVKAAQNRAKRQKAA